MKMSPDRTDACSAAIRAVARAAQDATLASDTGEAKARLNAVWFAVNAAQTLLSDAENATRQEAIAKLENAA